jgi:hypothetical protein
MTMFENLGRVMKASDTLKIECGECGRRRAFTGAEAFRTFARTPRPTISVARRAARNAAAAASPPFGSDLPTVKFDPLQTF